PGAASPDRGAGHPSVVPVRRGGWCNPTVPGHRPGPRTGKRIQVDRAGKKELVATLNAVFKDANVVVVAHYSGLTVVQMQTLRRQMKQAGAPRRAAQNSTP